MNKNTFYISAPVDTYSGYGARSRDLVRAIINQGKYYVKILSQRWGNTRFGYLKDHNDLREQHQERATKLKNDLGDIGIEVLHCATTHIVPVMVRDPKKCKQMSDMLLNDYNIYIQPINYPTVQRGTERLRIAPTPLHTDAMMHDLVEALRKTIETLTMLSILTNVYFRSNSGINIIVIFLIRRYLGVAFSSIRLIVRKTINK